MARKSSSRKNRGQRTLVVWGCLAISTVAVGGVLAVLDRSPTSSPAAVSPLPLMQVSDAPNLQAIFETNKSLDSTRWKAIVIHHTASPFATPQTLETQARQAGLKGLGHHFVIGNGNGMDDGQLHVGFRWMNQDPGAHALGQNAAWLNQYAISICLVGDGNTKGFSEAQMRRLVDLTKALSKKFNIPTKYIYLQSDVDKSIKSPGDRFPAAQFHQQLESLR